MFKRIKIQSAVRASALAVATAMAGMGTAGLSTSAQAVSVAHDGLGEAMIFPYYTTRNSFASYFNLTNTSKYTVFLKVRWNEGENSRDARDFNVVLSPYDMWTVATVKSRLKLGGTGFQSVGDENGNGDDTDDYNGMAITQDNSCTIPDLPERLDNKGQPKPDGRGQKVGVVPFSTLAFTGNDYDTGSQTHDRTREGYFTVFEMGVIDPDAIYVDDIGGGGGALTAIEKKALADEIIASAEHHNVGDNTGIPGAENLTDNFDCARINKYFENIGDFTVNKLKKVVSEPRNVLKGRAVLINLATGVAQGYDPITLKDFFSPNFVDGGSDNDLLALPSTKEPNLNDADPAFAQYVGQSNTVYNGTFKGADAVSELLARRHIINDYNLTSGSQTDWVITLPTKKFYVDADLDGKGGPNWAMKKSDLTSPGGVTFPYGGAKPNAPFDKASIFYDEDKTSFTSSFGSLGDREGSAGESCVEIAATIYDREEYKGPDGGGTVNFSPAPKTPDAAKQSICDEANILSFASSDIYGSKLRYALSDGNIAGLPGLNGWADLNFPGAPATGTITGIPVVGMRLEARENGFNPQSRYGFSSDHAYKR